jgi:hypothetical protein
MRSWCWACERGAYFCSRHFEKAIGILSEFSPVSGTSRGQLAQRAPRYPGVHPHVASGRAFGGLAGSWGYANVTGNRWVAGEDGCPAGRMVAFARVNEGEGSYLRLVITTCVAFGVETCSAH